MHHALHQSKLQSITGGGGTCQNLGGGGGGGGGGGRKYNGQPWVVDKFFDFHVAISVYVCINL